MLRFRHLYLLASFLVFYFQGTAQELFPNVEAATNVPKGIPGLQIISETYTEYNTYRNAISARIMYGITAHWTVWAEGSLSNHHDSVLPLNLVTHSHPAGGTYYFTNSKQYGKTYPYLFKGVHLYTKYRFLSFDGPQKHLRFAVYGEFSTVNAAHDEAEPNLNDNRGYAGGLLITHLNRRFALSISCGFIKSFKYTETVSLYKSSYVPQTTVLYYGDALNYSLSAGYRVYPKTYTDYAQDNYNLHVELIGKTYTTARVVQNDQAIEVRSQSLSGGTYVDLYIGIQRIVNSNFRMDLSIGMPALNRSFQHFYPIVSIGIQKYFFRESQSNKILKPK